MPATCPCTKILIIMSGFVKIMLMIISMHRKKRRLILSNLRNTLKKSTQCQHTLSVLSPCLYAYQCLKQFHYPGYMHSFSRSSFNPYTPLWMTDILPTTSHIHREWVCLMALLPACNMVQDHMKRYKFKCPLDVNSDAVVFS